jgi:hypothetical protein
MEEQILEIIEREPATSTRGLVARTGTSHTIAYSASEERQLYSCHIKKNLCKGHCQTMHLQDVHSLSTYSAKAYREPYGYSKGFIDRKVFFIRPRTTNNQNDKL